MGQERRGTAASPWPRPFFAASLVARRPPWAPPKSLFRVLRASVVHFRHNLALTGGYTGNTRAGPPGSVTIRRGLERVELVAIGMSLGRNCD